MSARRLRLELARHAVLAVAGAIIVLPFLWIAAGAFKTQIALLTGAFWFTPIWQNFRVVLFSRESDYLLNFGNSLLVGGVSTIFVLAIATMGAYSLVRLRWPGWVTHSLLGWSVTFHMVPPITMVGAWYVMFRALGLDATYLGLILSHIALNLPLALWIMTMFVREIPQEVEEAARIDGSSTPALLLRIVVPMVAPGLAAGGILVFVSSWNEFAVALNLTARATATVPVAIAKFAQQNQIEYTQMAASAVLSVIPAIVLLLFGQRYIVRGLTAGALK